MFDIQNYGSFILAIILFQLTPGPGTIAILNATARRGTSTGMKAVFGTLSGDFVYMSAATLGLASILNAYPNLLSSLQWMGVAYLFWMGWKLLRGSGAKQTTEMGLEKEGWVYFRQALAVSLTNPKVIIFFMAFFPLFLGQESTPLTLLMLMMHVTAISFLYQTGLVLVGDVAVRRFSQWRHARLVATRLAGVALIGFATKLALSNR